MTEPARHCRLRWSALAAHIALGILPVANAAAASAAPVEFNESLLRSPVDTRLFREGNPVAPGNRLVDVFMNGDWKGRSHVRFELPTPDSTVARPCFDRALLELLGVDTTALDAPASSTCTPLAEWVPGAEAAFETDTQRLQATAPQASLLRTARGQVDPALWDNGITAGLLQYHYNAYRSEGSGLTPHTSHYVGLRAGFNLGDWRFRHQGSARWQEESGLSYDRTSTYLERGIAPWNAKLVIGEATTEGQVFESLGITGVELSSDDRMYPDSQRGYAPVVRGVAHSNARVTITQRGHLIHEITVPAGEFVIDDLYPTGAGGDLLVTVTEADGSEHAFTVNYASIAELLRPGTTRFSIAAGKYRNPALDYAPALAVGTLRHGVNNTLTASVGFIAAERYGALSLGVALNTPVGAFSSDLTHTRTDMDDDGVRSGYGIRLGYANLIPSTGTNFTLAGYRYSDSGHLDPGEAFALIDREPGQSSPAAVSRKNEFQLSLAQPLATSGGTLNASASVRDYWGRGGTDTQYQIGYNTQLHGFGISLNANRTRNLIDGRWDNQVMLTVSRRLGPGRNAPSLTSSYARQAGSRSLQAMVSGTLGTDSQYAYSAYANSLRDAEGEHANNWGASGSWMARHAQVGGSYASSDTYQHYGASVRGAVVGYSGGLVLAPTLGDTMVIVEADGAGGAAVGNRHGLRLDRRGKAVIPFIAPYRRNAVELDPKGIPMDVSIVHTSQHVVPTAGAVGLLRFPTEIGRSVLVHVVDAAGSALPFGAVVEEADGRVVGYVGQGSRGLLRVSQDAGRLKVRWGQEAAQHCSFEYTLPAGRKQDTAGYSQTAATCVAPGAEATEGEGS